MKLTLQKGLVITGIPDMSYLDDQRKAHWRAWIDALRSGLYQQTVAQLHDTVDGFCCLGVACDLVAGELGDWISDPSRNVASSRFFQTPDGKKYEGDLPPSVMAYYGIPNVVGKPFSIKGSDGIRKTLVALNDGRHASFSDIAMILEIALAGGIGSPMSSTTQEAA